MKTRIISALVALPLLIFVIVSGGLWTHIGIAVLGLVGMYEFNKAISKEVKGTHIIAYIFGLIYVIFIDKIIYTAPLFSVFTSLFTIALLVYSVLCYKKTNYVEVVAELFGFFYACFLLSHVYLVREYDHGKLLIWLAFISAFGCDTGAYFTGYFLGKNKLCPALSPKKTIEGSVGGIITSIVLCLLYGVWINKTYPIDGVNVLLLCGLIGFAGSIISQIGDLAASSIKRQVGIKDYGNLMPGHGGVLDRFDSVIMTAPVLYYIMLFLIK
ncbi:MAG: phosphatidate cytidylyltransferase [Anaerotignum sp.]|nr:phosphatidate cytidylyltransferase [Anaerotignum sp.]